MTLVMYKHNRADKRIGLPCSMLLAIASLGTLTYPETVNAKNGARYPVIGVEVRDSVVIDADLKNAIRDLRRAAKARDRKSILAYADRGFFWDRDHGGSFDPKKSARENLTYALNIRDNIHPEYVDKVWRELSHMLSAEFVGRWKPGSPIVCLPGKVQAKGTGRALRVSKRINNSIAYGWVYTIGSDVKVRKSPGDSTGDIGQVSNQAIKLVNANQDISDATWLHVRLPNGRSGYVRGSSMNTFSSPKLCFVKRKTGWKINGYSGGGD